MLFLVFIWKTVIRDSENSDNIENGSNSGIGEFRDSGIGEFRDSGIQGFRNSGIEGILSILIC
jgi:hypothetical protein